MAPLPARSLYSECVVKQRIELFGRRRQDLTTHLPDLFRVAARPTKIGTAACLERRLRLAPGVIQLDPRRTWRRSGDHNAASTPRLFRERDSRGFRRDTLQEQRQA